MKYGNKKTEVDGITFDSKAEARRYLALKTLQAGGYISGLELQPVYEIAPSVTLYGRKRPAVNYKADFRYIEKGETVVEDVKGMRTPVYNLKRHLMKAVHGIEIRETT